MERWLYFAYGSNMAASVMTGRVPAEHAGRALLRHYRLAFTLPSKRWGGHAADLIPHSGTGVWGRLWRIEREQFETLDGIEAAYDRHGVSVERFVDGNEDLIEVVDAIAYTVKPSRRSDDEGRPSELYLQHILTGAVECDLPADYRARLAAFGV